MKTSVLTLIAIAFLTCAKAQTADEIIAKHIDAIGGKDKLAQVNSVYMESTSEIMGNESATKTSVVNGKGYRNESDFNGQSLVQVITDKGGWMINPFAGSTDAVAFSDDQFQASSDQVYIDPLFNYAANGAKVELQGQEKVGDINAYKIKYTNKYNSDITYYIDPSTWYVIQAVKKGEAMGQAITITVTPSDYKKTDFGVVFPNKTHLDMEQFALDVTVNKLEVNKEIDPAIFDMPK
ncbi:LolA-like protein [Parafilimonas terrae]|jgi:hypothetical protein|uniref:Outer membrane lipoprotein-sorting protein n=1 Tax=Parafilimonas terrae TaxID=1465490 RepID=A0A1I5Z9X2_9BACT|nr:hypothetical protein [Parafilimonas terrae]SFQ53296.1 hypothetical protein SAMN05444277_11830 [Parafilimonas terrae]